MLNNLHESMTLEQMQKSLVRTTSTVQQGSGPSLKETLDWLKEKIPLGTVNYVRSVDGTAVSINEQSVVYSLDSCTGVFGRAITLTSVDRPQNRGVGSYRYTVPLGVITESGVAYMENLEEAVQATFIGGDRWGYRVFLGSKSKDISLARFQPNSQTPVTETTNGLFLKFKDESIANRVLEAFKHAADLCRGKEAF